MVIEYGSYSINICLIIMDKYAIYKPKNLVGSASPLSRKFLILVYGIKFTVKIVCMYINWISESIFAKNAKSLLISCVMAT